MNQKLIYLLKKILDKKVKDEISLLNIDNNKELIKKVFYLIMNILVTTVMNL